MCLIIWSSEQVPVQDPKYYLTLVFLKLQILNEHMAIIDILLSLKYMIKPEISLKKTSPFGNADCLYFGQNDTVSARNVLIFSEHDFLDWCSSLPSEYLKQQFLIAYPEASQFLQKIGKQYNKNINFEISQLRNLSSSLRKQAIDTYNKFAQSLVFMSEKEYLDSITFNPNLFLFPITIYKLLSQTKFICLSLKKYQHPFENQEEVQQKMIKNPQTQQNRDKTVTYLGRIVEKIQKNLSDKMKLNFKFKVQYQQESILNQFNYYWKYCSPEERHSFWYLGYKDIKKAVYKFVQSPEKIDLCKLQQYIYQAQKSSTKQLKEQMFEWKLNETDKQILQYIGLLFNQLKQRVRQRNKEYLRGKPRKQKKKKIRQRLERRDSGDESSNETNQTDIIYEQAFDININETIENKLEKDIVALSDEINEDANLYHQNRELGYERLRHILAYINVKTKIYGSCCVGLAIKNSDIDVAIHETALLQYCPYILDLTQRISSFFQYLQYYFSSFPWIQNLKIISSATIPIIKFTIDNRIAFCCQSQFSPQVHEFLNKQIPNPGVVQIDLTIQTTQHPRKHLGIVSTKKTQQWLQQIPTLQPIAIILKNQLAINILNQTYYGGINTYTLLVMLVAYIRHEKLSRETRVSVVFQKVLKFYAYQFQEERQGIDINSASIFYNKQVEKTNTQVEVGKFVIIENNRQLEVKDPLDSSRITTRNCYKFKSIKKAFKEFYQKHFLERKKKIQQLCSIWNPKQNPFDQEMLLDWVEKQFQARQYMAISKIQ